MTKNELHKKIKIAYQNIQCLKWGAAPLQPSPRVQKQINHIQNKINIYKYILDLKGQPS